ncbi:hypothetical protein FKM82_000022 [Ascaphus truei]
MDIVFFNGFLFCFYMSGMGRLSYRYSRRHCSFVVCWDVLYYSIESYGNSSAVIWGMLSYLLNNITHHIYCICSTPWNSSFFLFLNAYI